MKFKPGDKVQVNNGTVWEVVSVWETALWVRTYPDGKEAYKTVLEGWQLVDGSTMGSDEYDEVMQAQAVMEGL